VTFEQQDSSQPPGSLSSAAVPNPDLYKRQLEVVCNNATLAIFIMNEQQQCTYMNPAAEKLTGYCLAEVQGRALHYIIHHTHPDGTPYPLEDCPIDQAFPQNNQEQGEEVFVHKDGSFYPVAYTASPIREGEGVIGTIIEVRDITQEKLAAQTQQELDRAKINFFSNVSHEFRTPLTLMLSPLEDLLTSSQKLPPQQRETLKLVHRNGQRLLKLVNTLLDFSRLEAGRIQAVYEPTDLATLTAELASGFRAAIERAGLRLVVECPLLPELVYVDRDLWEKIVLNLLSNAFKFTFEGTITVCLQALDQQVALIVQDTGVGIPAEELPRLFERFHRVSGTASRSYEGSGIGLSLVQELVKLHGGTVEVSSELEQGTTFTVTLPLGQAHLPLDRIQASRTSESTALGAAPFVEEALRWVAKEGSQTVAAGQSEAAIPLALQPVASSASTQPRILVADDNADMRQYIQGLLSQHYAVEAVADGESALRRSLANYRISS
jgi:PAS domain S-box-containing protein